MRQVRLTGHSEASTFFGDIAGGSTLILEGSNFAPLGDGERPAAPSNAPPAVWPLHSLLPLLSPTRVLRWRP